METSKWNAMLRTPRITFIVNCCVLLCVGVRASSSTPPTTTFTTPYTIPKCFYCAVVTAQYTDAHTGANLTTQLPARCGTTGLSGQLSGWGVHVLTQDGANHACTSVTNSTLVTKQPWIAVIKRGQCKFTTKILNTAATHNATAVVVYDNVASASLVIMRHDAADEMAVFTSLENGTFLTSLVDNGTDVWLTVDVPETCYGNRSDRFPYPTRDPAKPMSSHRTINVGLVCGVIIAVVVIIIIVSVLAVKQGICWKMRNQTSGVYRFRNF